MEQNKKQLVGEPTAEWVSYECSSNKHGLWILCCQSTSSHDPPRCQLTQMRRTCVLCAVIHLVTHRIGHGTDLNVAEMNVIHARPCGPGGHRYILLWFWWRDLQFVACKLHACLNIRAHKCIASHQASLQNKCYHCMFLQTTEMQWLHSSLHLNFMLKIFNFFFLLLWQCCGHGLVRFGPESNWLGKKREKKFMFWIQISAFVAANKAGKCSVFSLNITS